GFWYLYSRSKRAILPRTTIEKTGARHHDDLLAAATAAPPRGPLSGCRGRLRLDHRCARGRSRVSRDAEGAPAVPDARSVARAVEGRQRAAARAGARTS